MKHLDQRIRETAEQFPDRLAIQFRKRKLTYSELLAALQVLEIRTGSLAGRRILLLLPDGIPAYLCHVYCFIQGATVVPLTVQATSDKIKTICEKVQPHIVITNAFLHSRHKARLQGMTCVVVKSEEVDVSSGIEYDVIGPVCELPGSAGDPLTSATDVRVIVFTSGSTGEPKGVCLGESTILAAASMHVFNVGLGPSRLSLVTVPLYDYYGFIQIYSHIIAQGACILGDGMALPDQLFHRIRDERVTDLVLVPHTLREMLRVATGEYHDTIRTLQFMMSSSDTLTPELLRQVFQVHPSLKVVNVYGLTEAGRTCFRTIEADSNPSSSIGRPSPGVEIVIDDSEGEPGEIVIRGANVMRGYFQGIEDDQIIFKPCTEMRTGDLGYVNEQGEIVLLGRRDHMFNVKGVKIHPVEIERIALRVPGVADAQARAISDEKGEVFVSLDLVPANGQCDLEEVRTYLRRHLTPVFVPRELNIVPALQRTELGAKIIR